MARSEAPETMRRAMARIGTLMDGVATPCYIAPSIFGNLPFVTPDNRQHAPEIAMQVVDFADVFSFAPVVQGPQAPSLRALLHLKDARVVLSARDFVHASNPPTSKAGFAIATSTGKRIVAPKELMEAAASLEASMVIPIADEVPITAGSNRQRAAIQATIQWLDECLEAKPKDAKAQVCGVLVGGHDERLRQQSIEETLQREVEALVISGSDSCQDADARKSLLRMTMEKLAASTKAALPCIVTGIGHPLDVLDAVALGIDASVSSFPMAATLDHDAFIFWTRSDQDDTRVRSMERERSGSVLHVREPRFANDFAPLLVDCDCYTCRSGYTRAYLHHLLNAREMLGDTLLYMHNLHHYERFFTTMREQIATASFDSFATTFRAQYREIASTAPPVQVPLSIAERREQQEADKKRKKQHPKNSSDKHLKSPVHA